MTRKVTPMDIKMLVATLPEDANISEWCRKLGISRDAAYRWRKRFAVEGSSGLENRSRAPRRIQGKTSAHIEDLVVLIRKQLREDGLDYGPASVGDQLRVNHDIALVDSTIWRILKRRGQIDQQPKKRPKCSWKSFCRCRPNECWQGDDTHYFLASGIEVKIINMVDDHSRLNVSSLAVASCTSERIWESFCNATAKYGIPAEFLNDNGRAWISSTEFGPNTFQGNLLRLGVNQIHSSPYHPQTCGKVERFHQTQRKWLEARPTAKTIKELQEMLDKFQQVYNEQRLHRSIGRKTPISVWQAQLPASPPTQALVSPTTVALCMTTKEGVIRPANKVKVFLGRKWAGWSMAIIRKGDHMTVISTASGEVVRELAIEPGRYSYGVAKRRAGSPKPQTNSDLV